MKWKPWTFFMVAKGLKRYLVFFVIDLAKALDYRRPMEPGGPLPRAGPVVCRERLGGLLKSYGREAA